MQEYADPVIDWLDAGRGILGRRLFRDVRFTHILVYAPSDGLIPSHVHNSPAAPTRRTSPSSSKTYLMYA